MKNRSSSGLQHSQSREDTISASIREKQTLLITLYESIRTDYVSLFQHLYEIDEPQTVHYIDNDIVKGITFKESKINEAMNEYGMMVQASDMQAVTQEDTDKVSNPC